jgi:ubiquinone/menaquinone biosynthesis C-methylase UbiE
MSNTPDSGNIRTMMDADSSTYLGMQVYHNRLINKGMGGLFPEQSTLQGITRVLDIASGPGGWALDVAEAFPSMQVVGIDPSAKAIEYANMLALAEGARNATFRVTTSLQAFDFPDHSFDLVNERNFVWKVGGKGAWPVFLKECLRIARPGGIIRLTELEIGLSTSFGLQSLYRTLAQAFQSKGMSFSPDGYTFGIAPMLKWLLRQAGCLNVRHQVHGIDASFGEEAYEGWLEQVIVLDRLSTPFVVASGIASQAERDAWYQQALAEVRDPAFCCMLFFVTAWGTVPQPG